MGEVEVRGELATEHVGHVPPDLESVVLNRTTAGVVFVGVRIPEDVCCPAVG